MTHKVGHGSGETFLSFSIVAQGESSLVTDAANKIGAGNKLLCAMQPVYSQRYTELLQRFTIIESRSRGDFDFGAGKTLQEMEAALRGIYTTCSKPG